MFFVVVGDIIGISLVSWCVCLGRVTWYVDAQKLWGKVRRPMPIAEEEIKFEPTEPSWAYERYQRKMAGDRDRDSRPVKEEEETEEQRRNGEEEELREEREREARYLKEYLGLFGCRHVVFCAGRAPPPRIPPPPPRPPIIATC